jgi:hypothetical protein
MSNTSLEMLIRQAMQQWASSLPMVVVWIVGILFAFARWRKHPKVSLLVMLSCALSLLMTLVMPIAWHFVFAAVRPSGESTRYVSLAVSFLWACLAAVSSGLLIYAALVNRPDDGD